jgi:hypothetical protein
VKEDQPRLEALRGSIWIEPQKVCGDISLAASIPRARSDESRFLTSVDDTLEGPLGAVRIGEKSSTAFPDRKLPLMEYSLIGDEPQGPTGCAC